MNKILVVGPSWIGDMVMAQSLFMVLRQVHPGVEITVLAPDWSRAILARMPEVACTVSMSVGHGKLGWSVRRKLGHELRRTGFDQAIVLPGSLKSALIPWFARVPVRTGFVGEQRWGLLNDIRRLDKQAMPLNVQRFVSLGLAKSSVARVEFPNPGLALDPKEVDEVASRFGLDSAQPLLALCPGAEYGPAKQWPAEHFAAVANARLEQGWQVCLSGSENDREIAGRINRLCQQRCVDLTGRTSLGEAIDLISLAKFVVTNDSGLMHIAAAVGAHVIAIYGSSSDTFTPPLTEKCDRLNLQLECSPCFKRECPLGHLDCLNQLLPEQVLSLLE